VTTPNFQFSYIHAFSPTVLNEFRAGYAGNGSDVTVDIPGAPNIGLDDGTLGFGSDSNPRTFHENIYTYADMVSINHGKHNLRAGVEVWRNIENSNFNVGRPSYNFFDSLFFATDAPCAEGAGGRNTLVGPGYWAVDTSIFKTFQLSDRFRLQFRAEAFNVFNHTNFQLGGADIANLNDPLFGQAGGTFNPRQLQFGLKLSF
jgi:hypothetical protein